MIGILIALQINNWNEERKQEEEAIKLLSDFVASIEPIVSQDPTYHLMPAIQLDSVHHQIFSKTLEPEFVDGIRIINPRGLIIDPMIKGNSSAWVYNENVNTILQNERLFSERFSSIIFQVRRLNAAFQTMDALGEDLKTMQLENQRYLRSKDWMFKTDPESFAKRIEFFHSDIEFRNHLRSYQELNGLYLQQMDIFRKYQMFIWIEFQNLVNEKSMAEIFDQIEEFGFESSEEMACSESFDRTLEEGYASFYMWYPVFNNTSEPVDIYHLNPYTNENYLSNTIAPGGFSPSATSREFPYLQVGTNNACERQYEVSWDKVIIINP